MKHQGTRGGKTAGASQAEASQSQGTTDTCVNLPGAEHACFNPIRPLIDMIITSSDLFQFYAGGKMNKINESCTNMCVWCVCKHTHTHFQPELTL